MEKTTLQKTIKPQNQAIDYSVRYVLYARKSSESEERQVLSVDSQIKEMLQLTERENLNIVEIRKESHSAKAAGERPMFNEIILDIKRGKFNGILTWAPDRLSRNAGDLGSLVDLMDQKILLEIRTYGQRFTNSPNEKFLLMILCSQAKLENDNKSLNVKRGLRIRAEMGLWMSTAPTGYLNEKRIDRKGHVLIDPYRAPIIKKMFEKVAYEKYSGRNLYQWLNNISFKARSGKPLSLSNIYSILRNTFYYGSFEYPRESENWYQGKHEPLMTKELFDKVQERLNRDRIVRSENKEFAFTKLMKCGLCGSGITAEEKLRELKNGETNRHVYYACTKSKDLNCKSGYMREEDLIDQLSELIDKVSLDKLGVKERIEKEVERYRMFKSNVLNEKEESKENKEIDAKKYAKYLLREGTVYEKRELLQNLRSRLILENKKIYLEK
jgi:site-specific DNA recombinase